MNHQSRLKIITFVNHHVAIYVPLDADLAHPMDGGIRLLHDDIGQLLVDSAAGDALQIGGKHFTCVSRKMQFAKSSLVQMGNELANLFGSREHPTKAGVRIARVAAEFWLRGFLQHHDSFSARLPGGYRRFEPRPASSHHHYVARFVLHKSPQGFFPTLCMNPELSSFWMKV